MAFKCTKASSQYIELPTSLTYDTDADFSVGGWVKHNTGGSFSTYETLYFCGDDRGSNAVHIYAQSSFSLRGSIDDGTDEARTSGTQPFDGNTNWHHVLLTWNATTHVATLYVDGVSHSTDTDTLVNGTISPTKHAFGANWNGASVYENYGDFTFGEWKKWDRLLTVDDAASLAKTFAPSFYRDSEIWYVPMVRNYVEEIGAYTVTNNGSTVDEHPPIIYPSSDIVIEKGVARITYVGGDLVDSNSGTDLALTLPSHQADDFAIIFCIGDEISGIGTWSITVASGWTELFSFNHTAGRDRDVACFYKKLTSGSETNPTATYSVTEQISASVSVFRNVDTDTPFDVAEQVSEIVNTSLPTNPAITTVNDNAAIVLWHGISGDDITVAGAPTGYVLGESLTNNAGLNRGQFVAYLLDSGATGTKTPGAWTHTASPTNIDDSSMATIALRLNDNIITVTAPLLTASGLNVSASIDRDREVTAPLLTASGTIPSSNIDRDRLIEGILITASGLIPSDSILTGYVINAPLLTATGIQSPSLSYDAVLTAPLLTATGLNASPIIYEQFITGALLTASGYIAGSITYEQFVTGVLAQASGVNLPTFTFNQIIAAILLEASGLIPAGSVRNLWIDTNQPASNTWSNIEHDEDTLTWSNTEFKG